jgi:hypothetical protein
MHSRLKVMEEQARLLAASSVFLRILAALLAVDAVLVLAHILHELHDMGVVDGGALLASPHLLISEDHGIGEFVGYGKALVIAMAFVACYVKGKAPVFAALGFTFLLILLDDSLLFHEIVGNRFALAVPFESTFGLQAQDVGELVGWSVLGSLVVSAMAIGFRRSSERARALALIFLALLAALLFFAVFVDMLSILLHDKFWGAHRVMPLAEEGGEMLVLSITCAAAVTAAGKIQRLLGDEGPAP